MREKEQNFKWSQRWNTHYLQKHGNKKFSDFLFEIMQVIMQWDDNKKEINPIGFKLKKLEVRTNRT